MNSSQFDKLTPEAIHYQIVTRVLGWSVGNEGEITRPDGMDMGLFIRLQGNPELAGRVYFQPTRRPSDMAVVEAFIHGGKASITGTAYAHNLRRVLRVEAAPDDAQLMDVIAANPYDRCKAALLALP